LSFEEVETFRRSDFQIGSVPGNYFPLTAGSIVPGDFSTPLEMTGRFVVPPLAEGKVVRSTKGGDGASRQTVRLQTDIAAGNVSPTYGGQHSAGGFLDSTSLRSK
jgi:hypothetical protein